MIVMVFFGQFRATVGPSSRSASRIHRRRGGA